MHTYECNNGIIVPSVTTILKCLGSEALLKWSNWLGFKHISYTDELDKRANIGTKIHECIQHAIDPSFYNDKIQFANQIEADYYTRITNKFIKTMSIYNYKTIYTEKSFASSNLGYGGTIDWLFESNGLTLLADFKSSKKVNIKHILQLSGYRQLLMENNISIDGALIIIINENACFPYFIDLDVLEEGGKIFNQIKNVYDYLENKFPKNNSALGEKCILKRE